MCKACGNKHHIVMAGPNDWDADLKRIAKLLHSGKLKPGDVDPAMISKVAKILMSGVFEGYGKSFDDTLTIEEFGTLKALEQNVFVFSGFKNEKQLRETSLFLKDSDGNIKSFLEFLKNVKAVNNTYNEAYLSAEYGNAIASAQAISFWQESERNKKHVKNLRWRTAGDASVRPKHAMLDGLIRAKDDDFWKTHFIPLDWGCRCDIEETNDPETDIPEILPEVPPMFKNNVGISGIIFPETHPYFENIGKEEKQIIINAARNEMRSEAKTNIYTGKKGGYVQVQRNILKDDIKHNLEAGEFLADLGHKVTLLEASTTPGVKNPDAKILSKVFEFKTNNTATKSALDKSLRKAKSQADNILLHIKSDISTQDMADAISNRLSRYDHVKELWIIKSGQLYKLKRKEFLNTQTIIEHIKKGNK